MGTVRELYTNDLTTHLFTGTSTDLYFSPVFSLLRILLKCKKTETVLFPLTIVTEHNPCIRLFGHNLSFLYSIQNLHSNPTNTIYFTSKGRLSPRQTQVESSPDPTSRLNLPESIIPHNLRNPRPLQEVPRNLYPFLTTDSSPWTFFLGSPTRSASCQVTRSPRRIKDRRSTRTSR